jgi:hypothetical protein
VPVHLPILLARGGGPPYQLHYSSEQLRHSYPEIEPFLRAKDVYDPNDVLTSTFYEKYAPVIVPGARP